tara:strand:- start:27 stop:341 length:315 start_codon:yes stop_codon:yes gene_type:complete
MAAIVVRKSDNVVTHFTLAADFTNGYLLFTDVENQTTHSTSIKPDTHKIIDNVSLPKKWFGNCFKYEDGNYTILEDQLAIENEGRTVMAEKYGEDKFPQIEVEI